MKKLKRRTSIFAVIIVLIMISNVYFAVLYFNLKKETSVIISDISKRIEIQDNGTRIRIDEADMQLENIEKITNSNDKEAYSKIMFYSMKNRTHGEGLPWALLMANKWNYEEAMVDVYYEILFMYDYPFIEINEIDEISMQLALSYLIKAYETSEDSTWKANLYDGEILVHIHEGRIINKSGKLEINEKALSRKN